MKAAFPVALTLLAASVTARAGDAVSLEVVAKGQSGQSYPKLIVKPNTGARALSVTVSCGGAWSEFSGGASPGDRIELEVQVNPGRWSCTGKLAGEFNDGSSGDMPLAFDVEMLEPLQVKVLKDRLNLASNTMQIVLDRTAKQVDVQVFGPGGNSLGHTTVLAEGARAGTPIDVAWSQSPGEVIRIEVRATDYEGFWSQIDLFPWFYEIPHEDVVFATGSADIGAQEQGKLRDALVEVRKVLDKYGAEATVKLYVGGYTDTVGETHGNRFLSEKRAASIARWFRDNGFPGPIFFQGFGEKGQAVYTPDEVDEPRNRRAVYIVAAEPPPRSEQILSDEWKQL